MKDLKIFQKLIGYEFKNLNLLEEALTHSSYPNEHKDWPYKSNERLEMLGDSVLELAATDELFRKFPKFAEGDLTAARSAMVNNKTLSKIAEKLNIADWIFVSRGEAKSSEKPRNAMAVRALEAIIGAIYMDAGHDIAKKFVQERVLRQLMNYMALLGGGSYRDAKSYLQEKMQSEKGITSTYRTLKETGPENEKVFVVGVYADSELLGMGSGSSKKEAEQCAAKHALDQLSAKKEAMR